MRHKGQQKIGDDGVGRDGLKDAVLGLCECCQEGDERGDDAEDEFLLDLGRLLEVG